MSIFSAVSLWSFAVTCTFLLYMGMDVLNENISFVIVFISCRIFDVWGPPPDDRI